MSSPFTLTCYGAAGEVTGSKHLIQIPNGKRILLDCGLFQGRREEANEKNKEFGFDPESIDAVLISHAHVDHTGLLPKLTKEGYSGAIYASTGTKELCDPMLMDSARIQMEDQKFFEKHKIESPITKKEPIYTMEDVHECLKKIVGMKYDEEFEVVEGVTAQFRDAGHVFGSSIIVLKIQTDDGVKKLVFTGDLGRPNMPIIEDPTMVAQADILMIESTYGDRAHEGVGEIEDDLARIINDTAKRGGKIIIPAFALERTQEMILRLENLIHENRIPKLNIYVDSPLAGKLTRVFEKHPEYYDEELKKRAEKHRQIFSFPNLHFTESVEESKELNHLRGPAIIMAGSGMMENGRVRHHLKNHIEEPESSILVVGYQAVETLGRKIAEGNKVVKILRREYEVKAEVHVFKSLSAHADMGLLDEYVKNTKGLSKIFLVHGEQSSREAFAERIKGFYPDAELALPEPAKTYNLG
jgi:metallo-beta-lactamase family protein